MGNSPMQNLNDHTFVHTFQYNSYNIGNASFTVQILMCTLKKNSQKHKVGWKVAERRKL